MVEGGPCQAVRRARDPRAVRVSFAELLDRLTAAAVVVGVELDGGRHALVLEDRAGGRRIRVPVGRSFDRTATTLVLSAQLAEAFPDPARLLLREDVTYVGRWPEFGALWPFAVA